MRIAPWAVLVLLGCSEPRAPMQPAPPSIARPRIVAHRGASFDAPENTLAAFQRAWGLGVEAVELDVRVTKDLEVVVIHDATTRRTANLDLVVAEHTLAELSVLDAGSWKGAQFVGERIPTLRDVLATIPPGRAVFVEIKSPLATVATVAATIRDHAPSSATILLQGYDPEVLAALAAVVPGAPAYWTVDPPLVPAAGADDGAAAGAGNAAVGAGNAAVGASNAGAAGAGNAAVAAGNAAAGAGNAGAAGADAAVGAAPGSPLPYSRSLIDDAKRRGFAGLALLHESVDDEFLAAARAAGLFIDVWTANDAKLLATWAARDVRWIETDRPDLAPAGG